MPTMKSQIKHLSKGDKVLLYSKSILEPAKEAVVEKVTRDRVLIGGIYFDREQGYACGHTKDAYPPAIYIPSKMAPIPASENVKSEVVETEDSMVTVPANKLQKVLGELQSLIPSKEGM